MQEEVKKVAERMKIGRTLEELGRKLERAGEKVFSSLTSLHTRLKQEDGKAEAKKREIASLRKQLEEAARDHHASWQKAEQVQMEFESYREVIVMLGHHQRAALLSPSLTELQTENEELQRRINTLEQQNRCLHRSLTYSERHTTNRTPQKISSITQESSGNTGELSPEVPVPHRLETERYDLQMKLPVMQELSMSSSTCAKESGHLNRELHSKNKFLNSQNSILGDKNEQMNSHVEELESQGGKLPCWNMVLPSMVTAAAPHDLHLKEELMEESPEAAAALPHHQEQYGGLKKKEEEEVEEIVKEQNDLREETQRLREEEDRLNAEAEGFVKYNSLKQEFEAHTVGINVENVKVEGMRGEALEQENEDLRRTNEKKELNNGEQLENVCQKLKTGGQELAEENKELKKKVEEAEEKYRILRIVTDVLERDKNELIARIDRLVEENRELREREEKGEREKEKEKARQREEEERLEGEIKGILREKRKAEEEKERLIEKLKESEKEKERIMQEKEDIWREKERWEMEQLSFNMTNKEKEREALQEKMEVLTQEAKERKKENVQKDWEIKRLMMLIRKKEDVEVRMKEERGRKKEEEVEDLKAEVKKKEKEIEEVLKEEELEISKWEEKMRKKDEYLEMVEEAVRKMENKIKKRDSQLQSLRTELGNRASEVGKVVSLQVERTQLRDKVTSLSAINKVTEAMANLKTLKVSCSQSKKQLEKKEEEIKRHVRHTREMEEEMMELREVKVLEERNSLQEELENNMSELEEVKEVEAVKTLEPTKTTSNPENRTHSLPDLLGPSRTDCRVEKVVRWGSRRDGGRVKAEEAGGGRVDRGAGRRVSEEGEYRTGKVLVGMRKREWEEEEDEEEEISKNGAKRREAGRVSESESEGNSELTIIEVVQRPGRQGIAGTSGFQQYKTPACCISPVGGGSSPVGKHMSRRSQGLRKAKAGRRSAVGSEVTRATVEEKGIERGGSDWDVAPEAGPQCRRRGRGSTSSETVSQGRHRPLEWQTGPPPAGC